MKGVVWDYRRLQRLHRSGIYQPATRHRPGVQEFL